LRLTYLGSLLVLDQEGNGFPTQGGVFGVPRTLIWSSNSMKNLGFVGIAIAALAVSGCGGGGSSTPAVTTPTTAPTAAPTPGVLAVAYSSAANVGVSGAAPAALTFTAATETVTLTATQANNAGTYGATSSCAQVTVTPATSTTGVFTATSVAPAAAGCTVTITGATGTTAVAVTSTVPAPGGVILRWYTPNYVTQSPPVPVTSGPINLIGLGALFASVLQISEQNYIGGFAPANVKTSAGCAGVPPFATIAANGTVPTGLPTAAPGTSVIYYTVTGGAAVNTTGGCTISATDSYTTPSTANIGVSITTVSGVFQ
jgi:hypothetical protein